MRDQLIRYVDLLFAGAPDATDVKQEILQNTLERYDDLIAQGKNPQAAYSLAISSIGDINEILGSEGTADFQASPSPADCPNAAPKRPGLAAWKKALRAVAVCLYIICPIPLFVLSEIGMATLGLCGLLAIVAVATALMVISGGKETSAKEKDEPVTASPRSELRRAVRAIIWAVGMCVYFSLSFSTQAWYITWVLFPIIAATQGLVIACMDLKEANKYEN